MSQAAALTSWKKSALVPTSAKEFPHAAETAFFASSGDNFESAVFTTTLRHARPPLSLT